MRLPSDRYFEFIKTKEDYELLVLTGMAWEVEPDCPSCWSEHLEMVEIREKNGQD